MMASTPTTELKVCTRCNREIKWPEGVCTHMPAMRADIDMTATLIIPYHHYPRCCPNPHAHRK